MDKINPVPSFLYNPPCGGTAGLNVVLTWPHFGQGEYLDAKGPPHPPQNVPDWGGGANVVFTWPHFGQGEYLDAKAVPQLPQNPPALAPPDDCDLLGEPHDGQDVEVGDKIALQLVQVSVILQR